MPISWHTMGGSGPGNPAAAARAARAAAQTQPLLVRAQDTQDRASDQATDTYDVIGKALIRVPDVANLTNQAASPSAPTLQATAQVLSMNRHECQISVKFTNLFVEMPIFTFGWQLDHTTTLPAIPGAYPIGSAFVADYKTAYQYFTSTGATQLSGDASGYFGLPRAPYPVYVAVKIGAVLDALPGTNIWLHYKFTGRVTSNSNSTPSGTVSAAIAAATTNAGALATDGVS